MNRLDEMRKTIRDVMGVGFVRRSKADFALFVTDGNRRLLDKKGAMEALEAKGFTVTQAKGLWYLEPPLSFYMKPFRKTDVTGEGVAYALYRVISAHRVQYDDPFAVRMLLKAMEEGNLSGALFDIMCLQAEKLRLHKPLDGLLLPWLCDMMEGDISC